ncbi:ATP-grasp domain-containing protein [Candidatus Saccharibacteria bacterium]|nr:ATP-grasp domain-containing protein [Candidatus Saccharibacteria bacterium]
MNSTLHPFPELIAEICTDLGINLTRLSRNWVYQLEKDGKIRHIISNRFDLNPQAAGLLMDDKYACYSVLKSQNIPTIEHYLIFNPGRLPTYVPAGGVWPEVKAIFERHQRLVAKPNHGNRGRGIYLCDTYPELERAITTLFRTHPTISLCPFYDVPHEYRVFFLDGVVKLIYGKTRTEGEWKHNLTHGAQAFLLDDPHNPHHADLRRRLADLAQRSAHATNLRFATIDVSELTTGELLIMEINSGVAMGKFIEQIPSGRRLAKSIYTAAIQAMFP